MKIALYGIGLIGGSLGRAVLQKTKHEVYGYDINPQTMLKAKMLNAISGELTDDRLREADLVIFCLCPHAVIELMPDVCAKLKDGATVIDCCGNKRAVVAAMEKLHFQYPELGFVGVHPMAGREFSGVEHSTAGLFEHAYIIMTPVHSEMKALVTVKNFFVELGCEGIEIATAEKHDEIISYTSQLAHIVSSSYIKNPLSARHVGFSAGSFRDMTRVAKLSPDMWTELFFDNRDNLIKQITDLEAHLEEYKTALQSGDEARMKKLLEEGVICKQNADNALRERRKNDGN